MTTEITLLSQSHLPSIYFFSSLSSFSTSTPQPCLLLLLLSSPPFLFFLAPFYPLPVLLSCFSANIPLSVSSLSISYCLHRYPIHNSAPQLHYLFPLFMFLSISFFRPLLCSHFPPSIRAARYIVSALT